MNFFHFMPLEERIVLDATLLGPIFIMQNAIEGSNLPPSSVAFIEQQHSFTIASTDPNPINGLILWGDGSATQNINVFGIGSGPNRSWIFDPTSTQSTHIYKDVGTYNISFQPITTTGAPLNSFIFAQVSVFDAPLLIQATPAPAPITEGISYNNVVIGSFKDANPFGKLSDFSVTANANGPALLSNVAVVSTSTPAVFQITATILATSNAAFNISIDVRDVDSSSLPFNSPTITVLDAGLAPLPFAYSGTEGSAAIGTILGQFRSNNPYDTANEFNVTLNNPDLASYNVTNLQVVKSALDSTLYSITGDIALLNTGNGFLNFNISENNASTLAYSTPLTILNGQLLEDSNQSIIGTQGSTATRVLLGTFNNVVNNDLLTASVNSSLVSASNFSIELNPVQSGSSFTYDVYADLQFLQDSVGQTVDLPLTISDGEGAVLTIHDNLRVFDMPLTNINVTPSINAVEGSSFISVLLTFNDPEGYFDLNNYRANIEWGDGTSTFGSAGQGFTPPPKQWLFGAHTYQDVGTYNIFVSIFDVASGDPLFQGDGPVVTVSDAPLSSVAVTPVTLIEGHASQQALIGRFQNQNLFDNASNFAASVSGLPGVASANNVNIVSDGNGQYSVYADLLSTDIANGSISISVTSLEGSSFANLSTAFAVSDAPLSVPLPLTISANQGAAFSGIVGSFSDGNPYGLVGDFTANINWGDGVSSLGIITVNGGGGFNISGTHTYAINPDGLIGSIHIQDIDGAMADLGFNVTSSQVHQLLWGVDQSNGQLFSVSDYSLPGAETRVQLYGQLHTTLGTVIGDKILAFAIDGQDALGKNAAFIAVNKPLDGINTFSIGMIADINDAASRTNVTLFKISGISFDLATDKITSLAIDPLTGNLEGIIVRGNSPATLFVLNKNQLDLSSSNHIVQAYTLGRLVSKDVLGNLKVSNVQDMVFDQARNLYVTEYNSDKLYRIDNNTGEILAVANKNEDLGIGEANIKALAYDPVLNKVIGANAILNAGLPANDLVGLSLNNGANSLDVHLLNSLKDIQGMAFLPQFARHSGADLGLLIDIQGGDVDYKAGSGPVLLLHDVNIIDFGDKNYDGATLTIDVSDNPNALTDVLGIKAGDGIKVNSATGEIRYQNLLVGVIDAVQNGKNGQALTIHFNANATEKAVESLMERLTYMNTTRNLVLGERVIEISLYDALNVLIAHTTIDLEIEGKRGGCN